MLPCLMNGISCLHHSTARLFLRALGTSKPLARGPDARVLVVVPTE